MKNTHHYGTRLTTLRNRHFMEACRRLLSDPGSSFRTVRELTEAASLEPAPFYYVSFERALRVVRHYYATGRMPDGTDRVHDKWVDIIDRTERVRQRHGVSDTEALARVLEGGAPHFYLAPASALRLYFHIQSSKHK